MGFRQMMGILAPFLMGGAAPITHALNNGIR